MTKVTRQRKSTIAAELAAQPAAQAPAEAAAPAAPAQPVAPKAGKVVEILVADAQPVEFGEPLVVIE